MKDRVGFAGTGLMGRGMAKNILAAGYPLAVVAHRSRPRSRRLSAWARRSFTATGTWPWDPTWCFCA